MKELAKVLTKLQAKVAKEITVLESVGMDIENVLAKLGDAQEEQI